MIKQGAVNKLILNVVNSHEGKYRSKEAVSQAVLTTVGQLVDLIVEYAKMMQNSQLLTVTQNQQVNI